MIQSGWRLLIAVPWLLFLLGADVRAMTCQQQPLDEVVGKADAIFSGRVTEVRFLPAPSGFSLCRHDGEKCGEKVATIKVETVWKGQVDARTHVYSEDACYCLGTYFAEEEKRLFIVVRDDAPERTETDGVRIDFRTSFCGRSPKLRAAAKAGIIQQLDAQFDRVTLP